MSSLLRSALMKASALSKGAVESISVESDSLADSMLAIEDASERLFNMMNPTGFDPVKATTILQEVLDDIVNMVALCPGYVLGELNGTLFLCVVGSHPSCSRVSALDNRVGQ